MDHAEAGGSEQRAVAGLAQLAVQRFRIVEIAAERATEAPPVEDHRRRYDRAGQRAAPDLVDPAHHPRAAAFDREIRHPLLPRAGLLPRRRGGDKPRTEQSPFGNKMRTFPLTRPCEIVLNSHVPNSFEEGTDAMDASGGFGCGC